MTRGAQQTHQYSTAAWKFHAALKFSTVSTTNIHVRYWMRVMPPEDAIHALSLQNTRRRRATPVGAERCCRAEKSPASVLLRFVGNRLSSMQLSSTGSPPL